MDDAALAELKPCPFCAQPLTVRRGVNPHGHCATEDCWLHHRQIAIPLDGNQVEQWNTRNQGEAMRNHGQSIEALDEYLAEMDEEHWCQRLKYGQCSSRRCNVEGGWTPGNPADYSKATCARYRLSLAVRRELEGGDHG